MWYASSGEKKKRLLHFIHDVADTTFFKKHIARNLDIFLHINNIQDKRQMLN